MIWKGNEQAERLYVGSTTVGAIYKGAVKIWESVRSCFGSGVWRGDKPWIGTDKWK